MADIRNADSRIQGTVASGTTDADNPVKIGVLASDVEPTAVTAGKRINSWGDLYGRSIIAEWSTLNLAPVVVTLTDNSDTSMISAPGGSNAIYVCSVLVTNSSSTLTRVDLKDGSGGTVHITGVAAASGGGFIWRGVRPWRLTNATALFGFLSVAVTDIRITVEYFSDL